MKLTNKISVLILLLLSLAMLSSCLERASRQEGQMSESGSQVTTSNTENQDPQDSDALSEIEEAFNAALAAIVALDDETITKLENAYRAQSGYPLCLNEFTAEPGDRLGGTFCYGHFDGCIVVFSPTNLTVVSSVTVAGEVFSYGSSFILEAYHDGVFYPLSEAYEKGFVTKEEVALVAERHRTIMRYNGLAVSSEKPAEFKLEMPSEELQQRFVKEYLAYQHALYPTHYDLENPPDVAIEYWYGSFGDIHFLFVYDPLKWYSHAEVIEYIAGHRFHYSSSHIMLVWVDGEFRSIKEAYEQNLITEEMVATIANIRNGSDGRYPIKLR